MRRVLLLVAVAGLTIAGALAAVGAGQNSSAATRFTVELDNAFGLTAGSDLKVAGVRAGHLVSLSVDEHTHKALAVVQIDRPGFGGFRSDVFCQSKPQGLIGEYFIDCDGGRKGSPLKSGSLIGDSQTASTIPADLPNDTLRLPYAQRLSIILDQLGITVAGQGQNLSAAIRKGVPALREFDQVLAILATQNRVIADLNQQADATVTALSDNRRDVARWVVQAGRAATASASRQSALAGTWHRFPAFLEQLRPTMASLARSASTQIPPLQNLNHSSRQLTTLFNELGPFSDASRPATRSLGRASLTGEQTLPSARPTIALLRRFAAPTPQLAANLRIILQDLNDPRRAIERDTRSPGGQGFSGLEALLQYVVNQSTAINLYDQNGYTLRVSGFGDDCAPYTDAQTLKSNMAKLSHCLSWLGPNQPGITSPDPSASSSAHASALVSSRPAATSAAPPGHAASPLTPPPSTRGAGAAPQQAPVTAQTVQPLLDYLLAP